MNTTIKKSKQKDAILRILRSVNTHPNADWIYTQVRKELPNISLATVYRNLSRFAQEGMILKLDVGSGTDHFDGNPIPHYHLVCKHCGSISDLEMPYQEKLDYHAELTGRHKIDYHSLIFYGICSHCRNTAADNKDCNSN